MDNQPIALVGGVRLDAQNDVDDNLIELVEILQNIDITKPEAKLNETSITDNNGNRILL